MKLTWQNPDGDSESLALDQATYSLGRGDAADIRIADENASRVHAHLHCDPAANRLSIEDAGSRNGVYVNGQRIQTETSLAEGDTILVGATAFTVKMEAPVAAATEKPVDPQQTRVMSLDDIAALIDEAESDPAAEDNTREMEMDATVAIDAADIDATELLDLPHDPVDTPIFKLLVVSGDLYGKTYPIGTSPLVVGRRDDCSIVLKEGAVSGHHAQVRLDGDRVLLTDLGSKNGTRLDDVPISKETEIPVGTTFTIGATGLQLLKGETFVSGEKRLSALKGKKKLVLMAGLAALLLLMAGVKMLMDRSGPPSQERSMPPSPQASTAPPATSDGLEPLKPLAQTTASPMNGQTASIAPSATVATVTGGSDDRTLTILRETADAFMDNRLWQEAIAKLRSIQERDPADATVADLISQAEFEFANQQHFDKGLNHAARKQFDAAKAAFAAIPQNSVYHDEALLERQNAESAAAQQAKVQQAKAQQTEAHQARSVKAAPSKPKAKPAAAANSRNTAERTAKNLLEETTQAYIRGDVKRARETAKSVIDGPLAATHSLKRQAQDLSHRLQKAQSEYARGEALFKANSVADALKVWATVLAIDSEIAGKAESAYSRRIAAHMADHFYAVARNAYNDQNWAVARSNAVKSVRAKPDHTGGRSLLRDLNNRAKKLYEEGYILEDLNPTEAAERWRQVLQVGSPDNEYYRKAREKLAKYGG